MTKSKLLILAAAPALVLCSCAKKCSFADFQKAVSEIEKAPELKSITIKGSIKEDGEEIKIKKTKITEDSKESDISEDVIFAVSIMTMNHVGLYAIAEDKDVTYYAGSSFKIKADNLTMEWDKYGFCTSIEGEFEGAEVDLSASYSYK